MANLPKIAYFGSDAIGLPGLDFLHDRAGDRCELALVVSQPDRRSGRGRKLQANPVAAWATERGLPLRQPEKPDRALADELGEAGVAVALVMAYGHFLPKFIREAPVHGMVNFHGSILPRYRGASPIESAIAEGETETGVCLMEVVKEMDAGGVADLERIPIRNDALAPDVRANAGKAVVPLLDRTLDALLAGRLPFDPQDHASATFCRKIRKDDGAIDFTLSAADIYNRWRAFQPWPGAYFDLGETRVRVGRMECLPETDTGVAPGMVVATGGDVTVATAEGLLRFHELQRPGGKMLGAAEFLRGFAIRPGERLEGGKAEPLVSSRAL